MAHDSTDYVTIQRAAVRSYTRLQQLWRQVFCSCRSEAVEQLTCKKLTLAFN